MDDGWNEARWERLAGAGMILALVLALPSLPVAQGAAFDLLGYSVASGDFDGDGFDDLAVGDPQEVIGGYVDAGAVGIFRGRAGGILPSGGFWAYRSGGGTVGGGTTVPPGFLLRQPVLGGTEGHDEEFGTSLAFGDFDANGRDQLAIGTPNEGILSGGVYIWSP